MTILVALFVFSAHAARGTTSACARTLTIDERYERLPSTKADDPAYAVALTHLINEAWSPVLRDTAARIKAIPTGKLIDWIVKQKKMTERISLIKINKELPDEDLALGYNARFRTRWITSNHDIYAPYTNVNCREMHRWLIAVGVAHALELSWEDLYINTKPFRGAETLLNLHSFTQSEVVYGLRVANDTIATAASHLTTNKIPGMTTDQILRAVNREEHGRPSLMVQYALAMPPRLIGLYGRVVYVKNPLVQSDGRLKFSPSMRRHFNLGRQDFEQRVPEEEQFGHGCPVAHREPGFARSSLQDYLDAVMTIYDAI